ncbi:MAG TPA: tRNA 2-selenouridine(34) synthase MnmH [Burkholderiaceae bacterium]|nr:tRNA 2-selenouridine(34) synthase MnmH [Burkholderiaceae bacterium]
MKHPLVVGIDDAIADLEAFDSILDARSPGEFAEDRLPGATNTPVLDDAQRALVGTIYRQDSPFAARRLGAALVSRNIADILEQRLCDKPREWRPLVYCWRGGNRSGALSTVLARIGWRTAILDGGDREFRRRVVSDLAAWPAQLWLHVVAGRTGCGKSLILTQLRKLGAQVLDLEALARHRGSVLGLLPQTIQPTQKAFESGLWQAIRGFDRSRPVFVESESRRVGQCHLPEALIAAMRAAPGTRIEMKLEDRATLLLREYRHFTEQPAELFSRLERLVPLHGRRVVSVWRALAESDRWEEFVVALLEAHYDPAYDRSTTSNYAEIEHGRALEVAGIDEAHLQATARQLLESVKPPTDEASTDEALHD